MKKSILFYISRYPGYGGIEKVTRVLANYWVEVLKWDVQILSVEQQDMDLLNLHDSRIGFHVLPNNKNIDSYENRKLLNDIVNKSTLDYIIYQDSYVNSHVLLKCIKGKVKIVVVEHNMPNFLISQYDFLWKHNPIRNFVDFLKKGLYPYYHFRINYDVRKYHLELYDLCDKYLMLSERYVDVFKKVVKKDYVPKISWINNPITIETIQKAKTYFPHNIVFIGRIELQKGIFLLIDIWKDISILHPDWSLTIVGDGDLKHKVEKFINDNNIQRIQITGYQKDVMPYINEASILCMTSIFEGWPLVLFEAMSQGVVPIAFNSFLSVSEIISDNENGFIVPAFDKELYIKQLLLLMDDNKQLLKTFSDNTKIIHKNFSIDKISLEWEKVLV